MSMKQTVANSRPTRI